MNTRAIKKFKRFLKEEGVYSAYRRNLRPFFGMYGYNEGLDISTNKTFLNTCRISDALYKAFNWESSKQGFDFWYEIYLKWLSKVYK
jgi:hypothetical protein